MRVSNTQGPLPTSLQLNIPRFYPFRIIYIIHKHVCARARVHIFFAMAVRTNDARALAPSLELPAAVLKE